MLHNEGCERVGGTFLPGLASIHVQVLVADDVSLAHSLGEPAAALLADVQRR